MPASAAAALTHGLAPLGDEPAVRLPRDRTRAGYETHLTLRDLHRITWRLPPDTEVLVCENPRVVEAAAERGCVRPRGVWKPKVTLPFGTVGWCELR